MVQTSELTEVEKAQLLIEAEKAKRADAFKAEYDAFVSELCKKYSCDLEILYNKPQLQIIPK